MNKLSYHLILVNSSLRVLIDQIEQLHKCIESSFTEASQRSNYLLTTSKTSKKREFKSSNPHPVLRRSMQEASKAETTSRRPKKSIIYAVYESIKRSRKGITTSQIQKKTGLNKRQIANAVYKLNKKDMIGAKKRGVYVPIK